MAASASASLIRPASSPHAASRQITVVGYKEVSEKLYDLKDVTYLKKYYTYFSPTREHVK